MDRQRATHQHGLRELLVEVLASSDGSLDADLQALDEACGQRTITDSFYWMLAALTFEDRAVKLADTWLDDQDLPPARRERVIELLTSIPGYWPLHWQAPTSAPSSATYRTSTEMLHGSAADSTMPGWSSDDRRTS